MKFKVVKWLNEGSAEPFFARLFVGLSELRDAALMARFGPADIERARMAFDEKLEPVLEALISARNAMNEIVAVVEAHRKRVASGEVVQFQQHAFVVTEGIDAPLREHTATFLNRAVVGLIGVQHIMRLLDIPIGPLFGPEKKYAKWLPGLRRDHPLLGDYLDAVRRGWSESLTDRRGALEHEGWVLGRVDHTLDHSGTPPQVRIVEPLVDGIAVTDYVMRMGARVFAFAENVVAYGCSCSLRPPMTIMEIEPALRDPSIPRRFVLGIPGIGPAGTNEWTLRYSDPGFP